MPCFNMYRKGLMLFVITTRDGHAVGYLWAGSRHAALNRAERLAGAGADASHAATQAHTHTMEAR